MLGSAIYIVPVNLEAWEVLSSKNCKLYKLDGYQELDLIWWVQKYMYLRRFSVDFQAIRNLKTWDLKMFIIPMQYDICHEISSTEYIHM